jgi:hypothetical protein
MPNLLLKVIGLYIGYLPYILLFYSVYLCGAEKLYFLRREKVDTPLTLRTIKGTISYSSVYLR